MVFFRLWLWQLVFGIFRVFFLNFLCFVVQKLCLCWWRVEFQKFYRSFYLIGRFCVLGFFVYWSCVVYFKDRFIGFFLQLVYVGCWFFLGDDIVRLGIIKGDRLFLKNILAVERVGSWFWDRGFFGLSICFRFAFFLLFFLYVVQKELYQFRMRCCVRILEDIGELKCSYVFVYF